jgi:hypothetical protein
LKIQDREVAESPKGKGGCITLSIVKGLIMTSPDLDTIRQNRDQSQKQQIKKHIQKDMQKQLEGIGTSTRKIIGTLLHLKDSYFRINDSHKKMGLKKKKDSKE